MESFAGSGSLAGGVWTTSGDGLLGITGRA